ncbi:TonB-dependent receptor [Zunongwangia sp.]|uniref:TonB-dependent receptor n=1 Tax=Zunongwangia sp. TaxID=1965325 RepID=UPI003AA89C24
MKFSFTYLIDNQGLYLSNPGSKSRIISIRNSFAANFRRFSLGVFIMLCSLVQAQQNVSGSILDKNKKPISGANVYIKGSYDGEISDSQGNFSFNTLKTGTQTLVISFLSFETKEITAPITDFQKLEIILSEKFDALDAVVLNAGNFEAGTTSKVSVLKPLDILTTAGSVGNIITALETLPGTQNVGESGRLFVRGGEASETQTYVDGLRVAQPYSASVQNLPSRGRFSPYLFKGMSFSTGGYSAEYGNALSSVLLMNTKNDAEEDNTEISVMTVGLGLGKTKNWEKSSLQVNANYTNLEPYQSIVNQNINYEKPYQSLAGEAVYKNQFQNGLFKLYTAYDHAKVTVTQPTPDSLRTVGLTNSNFYLNASYQGSLGNKWHLFSGVSLGTSRNDIDLATESVNDNENSIHLKSKISKRFTDFIKLNTGVEYFLTDFQEDYTNLTDNFTPKYQSQLFSAFSEIDIYFSPRFATKIGVRATHDKLLNNSFVSPRISSAYKLTDNQQLSVAFGDIKQQPNQEYLKFDKNLFQQKATHYILNYQYANKQQVLRLEGYYKKYKDLLTFSGDELEYTSAFTNSGSGYAKGLDLFWRDEHFKNLEYWVSYSYIDTQRKFRNYPQKVTPNFVAKHNASLVTKYWIEAIRSQIGFTYNFNSGRPYNNPNSTQFMAAKTKKYHTLNFNLAYLLSKQQILYFSVSNVLNTDNIYGYDYSNTRSNNGSYNAVAVRPSANRFFFVGFFWTLSNNKNRNQLDQL